MATPTVTLARDRAAIGSPLKVSYKFAVEQNASIPQDYLVFVHVLDDQGERLWGDDHSPTTPTSQWKPGQTVEYTRTVFVPNYPYIGPAHVRIGLYLAQRVAAPAALCHGHRAARVRSCEVPAPAAVGEHLPCI